MPVTVDRPGPYTSPKAIIELIERHRDRGLPVPVNNECLARAGVSESLIPRTLQSMHGLDLITEDGALTDVFESLRLAPQTEYQARVKAWLDATYADVLQFVDPANDDETKVRDAFRNYKPFGQRDRMVTLFLRLYEHAGVAGPKAVNPPPRSRPATTRGPAPVRIREVAQPKADPPARQPVVHAGGLPPAIAGLLHGLPTEGQGWTKERRDGFMTALGAVVDYCFPIVAAAPRAADDEE